MALDIERAYSVLGDKRITVYQEVHSIENGMSEHLYGLGYFSFGVREVQLSKNTKGMRCLRKASDKFILPAHGFLEVIFDGEVLPADAMRRQRFEFKTDDIKLLIGQPLTGQTYGLRICSDDHMQIYLTTEMSEFGWILTESSLVITGEGLENYLIKNLIVNRPEFVTDAEETHSKSQRLTEE